MLVTSVVRQTLESVWLSDVYNSIIYGGISSASYLLLPPYPPTVQQPIFGPLKITVSYYDDDDDS